MANSKELFGELVNKIRLNESKEEVESIVYLVLENQLGLSRMEVLSGKKVVGNANDQLAEIVDRINREEPVQYILGEAWFYGRKFIVNPSVLIPRSETELIVEEAINALPAWPAGGKMLDVGTGSGCLAITLVKEFPAAEIHAIDVSAEALVTAAGNAKLLQASVEFHFHDILTEAFPVTGFEVIVSNPPYVTWAERSRMAKNILNHEPERALFVPDDDPLIFYKAIAQQGRILLKPGGRVIVEINERFGSAVVDLFGSWGYSRLMIRKDLGGKDRIVCGIRI